MQPPYNDRWERKKWHLMRNCQANPGFQLSPVPEEERSSPDSSGSLPELVVERAPDRHDDPPEYYEGLERRMKRFYRQLLLGAHGSDDDPSSDFEVNRSMASTFKSDIDTRKDKAKGDSIIRSINSDDDYNEIGTHDDKLIDTFATFNATSHISIDDSNKSSSTEAHSKSHETDVDSNENDNNEDNPTNQPKATDEDRLHLQLNDGNLTADEIEEIIDDKSVSEDSTQDCHRVSTTIAQIHQPRPERPQMVDNGSPVLISRLIQFGRALFGRSSAGRYSEQSINVLLASDEITKTFSPQKSAASNELDNTGDPDNNMERLLTASENQEVDKIGVYARRSRKFILQSSDEESDEDLGPIAQSSEKSLEDMEPVELMRGAVETRGNLSRNGETSSASPALAFEAQTSAKELQNISTNSNEMNASHEQNNKFSEDYNTLDHDTGDITNQPSDDYSSNRFNEAIDNEASDDINTAGIGEEIDNDSSDNDNIGRITEDINNESSDDHSTGRITEDIDDESNDISTPDHNYGKINASDHEIDEGARNNHNAIKTIGEINNETNHTPVNRRHYIEEFWSVSPIDINIEDDNMNTSNCNKRRTVATDECSPVKKKKDAAVQTSVEERKKWSHVNSNFIVGTPLGFRLCRCRDHDCS